MNTQNTDEYKLSLPDECDVLRKECKVLENRLRLLMRHERYKGEQSYVGQHPEMKAQTMLAVRAVEECRMRIGKILQYSDNGVSIYDKT